MKKSNKYILSLWLILLAITVNAQEITVPIDQQVPIFAKIFQFDRSLTSKSKSKLVICIIFQSKNRESKNNKEAFVKSIYNNNIATIAGKKIEIIELDINSPNDINNVDKNNKIDILVITNLKYIELSVISEICKTLKIISYCLSPSVFEKYNFGISLDNLGDRPQININLKSVKREGADFSSQLLKLSKINDQ